MRDERLQVRVDAATKRRLEDAASELHLSLSAFVLQAATVQAESVLSDRQTILLSPDAAAAFAEALARPAEVNDRLTRALSRPATLRWLD